MRIIFHHPLPLDPNAKSASGIRPLRMLEAFKALGCQVDLVTGYSTERKRCISKVMKSIKQGKKYGFVYSESSTMPTILTDPHHLPLHPLMDWFFLRFCKKNNIPVGLFYRDIYWLFESYGKELSPIKRAVAKSAYWFDLWVYQQTLSKLYLPSSEMGSYVPKVNAAIFEALPPGHTSPQTDYLRSSEDQSGPLELFYVGGMSSHYQLHVLFEAVCEIPQVNLTVCTRKEEWENVREEYPVLSQNIRIIHKAGVEMEAELQSSDVAVLFVKPKEYWEFASPVKLYEYLGFSKSILASEGTLAGQFVDENHVGWTIPYDKVSVMKLLKQLASDPLLISDKQKYLKKVAPQHSWQARAQQVVKDLT